MKRYQVKMFGAVSNGRALCTEAVQKAIDCAHENGEAKDLEYPTQQMLGWTAGVYTYLCLQAK